MEVTRTQILTQVSKCIYSNAARPRLYIAAALSCTSSRACTGVVGRTCNPERHSADGEEKPLGGYGERILVLVVLAMLVADALAVNIVCHGWLSREVYRHTLQYKAAVRYSSATPAGFASPLL